MQRTLEQQLGTLKSLSPLGHTGLDIKAKGQCVHICFICISGCCMGSNCADWKHCCSCGGE